LGEQVIIVTCAEPDALSFLRGLREADLTQTTLVATADVIRSAERQTLVGKTVMMGGRHTFAEVRRVLSGPGARVTIVVAPDPWGPFRGKGFVRARQILSLVLLDSDFDVIELERGGMAGRVRRGVRRAAFAHWIRRRELLLLGEHVVHLGMVDPEGYMHTPAAAALALVRVALSPLVAAVTLARVLPFIARTEVRARRVSRRS